MTKKQRALARAMDLIGPRMFGPRRPSLSVAILRIGRALDALADEYPSIDSIDRVWIVSSALCAMEFDMTAEQTAPTSRGGTPIAALAIAYADRHAMRAAKKSTSIIPPMPTSGDQRSDAQATTQKRTA